MFSEKQKIKRKKVKDIEICRVNDLGESVKVCIAGATIERDREFEMDSKPNFILRTESSKAKYVERQREPLRARTKKVEQNKLRLMAVKNHMIFRHNFSQFFKNF